jgi:hypothetical protein
MLRDFGLPLPAKIRYRHTLPAELSGSKKRLLENAPEQIITGPGNVWCDSEGRIQRAGYSLCLLERLQDSLRRRDIWLENSDRWGDPRQVSSGERMAAQRIAVCRGLDTPPMVEMPLNSWQPNWTKPGKRWPHAGAECCREHLSSG